MNQQRLEMMETLSLNLLYFKEDTQMFENNSEKAKADAKILTLRAIVYRS